MFIALLVIGIVTIYFLARYFMRQIEALQGEVLQLFAASVIRWPHVPDPLDSRPIQESRKNRRLEGSAGHV